MVFSPQDTAGRSSSVISPPPLFPHTKTLTNDDRYDRQTDRQTDRPLAAANTRKPEETEEDKKLEVRVDGR